MREIQALLDTGFRKLTIAEAELDHRARWDVPGLAPLEKVAIILNDLFCEADRGGFDYWLQRGYAARGKYELQRRAAAIVERHYDLDPVAAEILLAMLDAVERAPGSYDPGIGVMSSDADSDAYQALCDARRFVDAAFSLNTKRMWSFIQGVVDAWDPFLDPFTLPAEPPNPRRRIPVLPPRDGAVKYPSVSVGATKAGRSLPFHAASILAYDVYMTAALALWIAGAPLERVSEFAQACEAVRDDMGKVIDVCAAWVDLDGTAARTGKAADRAAIVKSLEWSPAYAFESMVEDVRSSPAGGFIATAPSTEKLGPTAAAAGIEMRTLGVAEGLILPDAKGPDREKPVALHVDGSSLKSNDSLDRLLELAGEYGIVLVVDLPEQARQYLGFRARTHGLEHVNFHPDDWSF